MAERAKRTTTKKDTQLEETKEVIVGGKDLDEAISDESVEETTTSPDLTIQDLQSLRNIIDVASQRGAFRPAEMVTVGQTYNKLDQFLIAVANSQKAQTQSQ